MPIGLEAGGRQKRKHSFDIFLKQKHQKKNGRLLLDKGV